METLLSVGDLVAMPTLGQRVVAGDLGLSRVVLWAHSCELTDPWRWLGPDELLMTVGLCVPEDPGAQVEFVHQLAASKLAGVTIGDDEPAPTLSSEMLAEADRLGFPLLRTSIAVPFVSIGRTVALAGSSRHQQQLLLLGRLYRMLTTVTASSVEALEQIEDIFGVELAVVDTVHQGLVMSGSLVPDPGTIAFLCERALSGIMPVGSALPTTGDIKAWPLPSERPSLLMLRESRVSALDAFLVGHLIQAMTAAINGIHADLAARAARAEQLFSAVLVGQSPLKVLVDEAAGLGVNEEQSLVAVAVATESADDSVAALGSAGIRFLPRRSSGRLLCCVREADLEAVLDAVASTAATVGVSGPFSSLADLRQGLRDATWALDSAGSGETVVRYEEVRGSIVPRDADGAREISEAILGPLLGESDRSSRLLDTLAEFLDHDRSWNETARALDIHRQTLAHRLRRIEHLTGRSLKSSADIATLWVAIKATQRANEGS